MAVLAQRCAMLVCVAVAVTALCQGVGAFGEHSTSGARELLATTVRVAPTPPPGQSSSGSDTVGCGMGAATPCATIQYAINGAAQFSTILLLPGVHTATGNSTSSCPAAFSAAQASQFYDGITFGGKSLTIKASPPMSASITAQGCGRVFQFVSGETPSAVVRDLQVRPHAAVPLLVAPYHVHQHCAGRSATATKMQGAVFSLWVRAQASSTLICTTVPPPA